MRLLGSRVLEADKLGVGRRPDWHASDTRGVATGRVGNVEK